MAWRIEISAHAQRQLDKLDPQVARRLTRFLYERVAILDDPYSIGESLHGSELGEFWKYRVGDWRIVCLLEDQRLIVTVVRIGHRREVYR